MMNATDIQALIEEGFTEQKLLGDNIIAEKKSLLDTIIILYHNIRQTCFNSLESDKANPSTKTVPTATTSDEDFSDVYYSQEMKNVCLTALNLIEEIKLNIDLENTGDLEDFKETLHNMAKVIDVINAPLNPEVIEALISKPQEKLSHVASRNNKIGTAVQSFLQATSKFVDALKGKMHKLISSYTFFSIKASKDVGAKNEAIPDSEGFVTVPLD